MLILMQAFPEIPQNNKVKKLERIASLDFLRGLAIFFMVFIHGAANIIDSSYIEEDFSVISSLSPMLIFLIVFLGFFAIWNSFFLLISTTVNSFAMARGIYNGRDPGKILFKQSITGIGLLIVNMIDNSFLMSGYFGTAIKTGDWSNTYPLWRGFFEMGTLRIIALSLIINSIILFFLLRKDGYKKFIRNIAILGSFALIIIIASEFVNNWIDGLDWKIPTNLPPGVEFIGTPCWPDIDFQALNASFKSWICTILSGDIEPFFPYLASAFIGAIIGLCLAKPKPIEKLPLIGGLSSVGITLFGGLFIALGFVSFDNTRPPIGNYLVMLGVQLCSLFLLLWLVEYRGKSQKFGDNIIVKHFRLWGMVSLSLYVLQILELFPRWFFGVFFNLIFKTNINAVPGGVFGQGQEFIAIFFAFISILFFELVVFLWSRINFIFSFEWFIVRITGLLTKRPSKRLNVELMMNEIEWLNYKERIKQKHKIIFF